MERLFDRALRLGLVAALAGLLGLIGGTAQAQGRLEKLAFSVLAEDQTQPVHIAQIAFSTVGGSISVSSTVGFTQRVGLLRVETGESFKRTLFLGNETGQEQRFTVLLLLDDRQVELALDGRRAPVHTLAVDADSQVWLPMAFPAQSEAGLHNFVLLVFYELAVESETLDGLFTPYADSLMVGDGDPPARSVAAPGQDAFVEGRTVRGTLALPPRGVSLSRTETPETDADLLDSPLGLSAGQRFAYFVHVRNGQPRQPERDEFVLVVLWDGVQVPVQADADDPVVYFTLPANGLVNLPATLAIPDDPGEHTLDILAIRNPYQFQAGMDSLEVLHERFQVNAN